MLNILFYNWTFFFFQLICDLVHKYVFSTVLNFVDFKFPPQYTFSLHLQYLIGLECGLKLEGLLPLVESCDWVERATYPKFV